MSRLKGLEQTRPWELEAYVDDGSISSDEIVYVVDHSSWPRPKRITATGDGGLKSATATHIESDRLTNLSSRTVTVEFDSVFTTIPVGDVQVYRMTEVATGKWRKEGVLWGFTSINNPTTSGFTLEIDSSESLTGVYVEYSYL